MKGLLVPTSDIVPPKKKSQKAKTSPDQDTATDGDFDTLALPNSQSGDEEWSEYCFPRPFVVSLSYFQYLCYVAMPACSCGKVQYCVAMPAAVVRTKASAERIQCSELANIQYHRHFSTSDLAYGFITFLPLAVKERCCNPGHQIVSDYKRRYDIPNLFALFLTKGGNKENKER